MKINKNEIRIFLQWQIVQHFSPKDICRDSLLVDMFPREGGKWMTSCNDLLTWIILVFSLPVRRNFRVQKGTQAYNGRNLSTLNKSACFRVQALIILIKLFIYGCNNLISSTKYEIPNRIGEIAYYQLWKPWFDENKRRERGRDPTTFPSNCTVGRITSNSSITNTVSSRINELFENIFYPRLSKH